MKGNEISRRKFIKLTGGLALASTVPGCLKEIDFSGDEVSFTDLSGREVSVEAPVDRIVSTYNFDELVAVGGEGVFDKTVGHSEYWDRFSPSVWDKYTNKFPQLEEIPNVGYRDDVDVEHVISLDPDVVITSKGHYGSYTNIYNRISNAGIPVVALNYHEESIEDRKKSTELLGVILGKEDRAQKLWEYCEERYNEVFSRLETINNSKPRVYLECRFMDYSDDIGTTYGDTNWGAMIKQCRGENIAAGKGENPTLSEEYILKMNPEVFIVEGVNWTDALGYTPDLEERDVLDNIEETYFNRSGWRDLTAWKERNYHAIHHAFFRSISDFIGYQFIAKVCYPSEFKDINPEKSWKEFHNEFLPIDYSGSWLIDSETA
ncbi:ABC transporter substrate-binding protein [Methanonatronarchaeum sp. AMET-Sl]|uniref:ABC transporter substrate-binding protein n=1 Tax=Methanonatronarchaeum sp. AMET-Sl TaxID=3037654 RepID=UPI00244DBE57|nr:ABC transporter substrate-binding protein [Methanonatronarchaeum sp. AMET-Sl]WGI17969.1 ABC transporter substrate-binding protein [Methanonatronarchaeum sp. AMET-Sl]